MSKRLKNDEFEFDVVGDIWETLRFRGVIFFRSELAAPWGVSFTQSEIPQFHIALSGNFFISTNSGSLIEVREMGLAMIPNGESHWIADQPGRELIPSKSAHGVCGLSDARFQQGEITNRLMCGLVEYDSNASHPLLKSLPDILHFPEFKKDDPVWMIITLIDIEMGRAKNQNTPIVNRLTEVLFLELLNLYIKENETLSGFPAAMQNHRIHHVLKLIHKEPDFDWSLSSLGEQVGMSRATLNRHFQEALGMAPMTYITNWRIMKAYNLVKFSNVSLEQIADSVGFASARTLSKAFQRRYGCTPSELRKTNRK